jgi:multiple sugar transport system ATP-binding protein
MNFVLARLVRDDGPAVTFAGHRLPLELLAARPGLDRYFGREVILGIRPSDFEDAALADPRWARMPVQADVTEALGSEVHVIFSIDAPAVRQTGIAQATSEGDDAVPLSAGKIQWTARVAARSLIQGGHAAQLAVDTSSLHFFDPASERAIGIVPAAR